MAKRFIDTDIFQDEWFSDLTKDGKLLWIYIITNCDHAGILKLNRKLIKFQTGISDIDKTLEELSNSYLTVSQEYIFCFKFIKFQYPNFPNSAVKQQDSAIKILQKFDLWNYQSNSYLTVSEHLNKCYVNDNVIDNVNESVIIEKKQKNENIPTLQEFGEFAMSKQSLIDKPIDKNKVALKYESWKTNQWKDGNGNKISNWKSKLINTLQYLTSDIQKNNSPKSRAL